ncbi:glycosyltransferase family 2 protein [Lactococcus formosensis]|jgi:Glycosyltransferases involved in cell wall biogenesis|uniref:Glycosyltransferase family 2 protein n=2 Tax=Lactococcus formosensis TaxID=1281486 RepID=A0A9X4PIR2_9LACT|nr:glycosyltransferase family 2 protein [Lactococcus formosensis]MCH1723053.1 glycosyltransferase family 2 protein [Lactococcus formosensis]MDG6110599.1 glycosyltransferase family 2 protein [Lactococcus formosensis]MDG6112777.1 glycosyltransferase family 2 protein [Lactococcus formosensis]MDG6115213.1 glycosyltransferase family 2 protein [Lactococcus formosensis]MDG6117150.1 glycosyltransferase family 2 protein [Lactococcus formosensis]
MKNKTLSIIVPAYNEEETIELFFDEVNAQTLDLPLDKTFYFINDGSSDRTLDVIKTLSQKHPNVKYISFSRNFGKEAALLAGLRAASGDFVTVMDADLQDPPSMLNEMYRKIQEGYDIVGTRRISRKDEPFIRSLFARAFYKIMNTISSTQMVDGARDYRLMTRQVVDSILELPEHNRFSKGLFSWVGYDVFYLEYNNVERVAGKTSWSFWGLLHYSIDGIVNFSDAPLSLATFIGFISFLISLCMSLFYALKTIIWGEIVQGFPTLIILILMLGGLQLLSLGIIGKYLSKVFLETKQRPNYFVKEDNIDK